MIYNVARAVNLFFNAVIWLIIIRGLASIIIRDYGNPIVKGLYEITEPILAPFRNIIGRLNINTGMMDFSPLLAVVTLNIVNRLVLGIIL